MSINSYDFSDEQKKELKTLYVNFNGAKLAVRSSSILEDLKYNSFAGLYDTILNISSFDEFIVAIQHNYPVSSS